MGLADYFFGTDIRQAHLDQIRYAEAFDKPKEVRRTKRLMRFDLIGTKYLPNIVTLGSIVYALTTKEYTTGFIVGGNSELFRNLMSEHIHEKLRETKQKRERHLSFERADQGLEAAIKDVQKLIDEENS